MWVENYDEMLTEMSLLQISRGLQVLFVMQYSLCYFFQLPFSSFHHTTANRLNFHSFSSTSPGSFHTIYIISRQYLYCYVVNILHMFNRMQKLLLFFPKIDQIVFHHLSIAIHYMINSYSSFILVCNNFVVHIISSCITCCAYHFFWHNMCVSFLLA